MAIKVAFFDCDGTLTEVKSSWEYLHRRLNIWDNNADHYQALFRAGKIDYHEFCRRDALLWRGLPVAAVTKVLGDIPYQPHAHETIQALREKGVATVILSTGLSLLVDKVRQDLGIDLSLSNELLADKDFLTGGIRINVDYNRKDGIVKAVLDQMRLHKEEACAVGDGEGDTGMFEEVGLSIGFRLEKNLPKVPDRMIGRSGTLLDIIKMIENHGD